MGKSYQIGKQTHWGQTSWGQINVHYWCKGGGMINVGLFFSNGCPCPTDISSTVYEKCKNLSSPHTHLKEIYKVTGLSSSTDLQYMLITALSAVTSYGNFPLYESIWMQFFFRKQTYFAAKMDKNLQYFKETYCCKNRVHKYHIIV